MLALLLFSIFHHKAKPAPVDPRDAKAQSYYESVDGLLKDARNRYPQLHEITEAIDGDLLIISAVPVADPSFERTIQQSRQRRKQSRNRRNTLRL